MSRYKKLVRDKIPEIIEATGEIPIIRKLDDVEYKQELEKKLYEECLEVTDSSCSNRIEELADVIEVVKYLAMLEDKSLEDVIEVAKNKFKERGGFDKKIYLEGIKEK